MTLTRWFGVASGAKYDVSIAAITDTPEREKEVTFSDSYYMDDQAIVTKVDNTDITADNYSEKLNNADATIIVQSGSTAESFAQENFLKGQDRPLQGRYRVLQRPAVRIRATPV